jgi:gliding motility-associated-like protein
VKQILLFATLTLYSVFSFSQGKQANYWYFGAHAGLNYNTGSPPSALSDGNTWVSGAGTGGSASISDAEGNLLFYSDGRVIWNKNHIVMLNGSDIGHSSTQGAMIVPYPGNNNLYYYFNFDKDPVVSMQTNFQYSVIDMTLDNGLGGVIPSSKSILLLENTTTHLSAVFHKNGEDIWVVTHGSGDNQYYCYLVTPNGLTPIPEVSSAGTLCDSNFGYLKISPNGKKIAVSQMFSPSYSTFFDLVDFDNETGVVSDANLVHSPLVAFGLEFSPDNSKLYTNFIGTAFFQYNLNAGSPQQILDSKYQIVNFSLLGGALQLGPDGKIVCATDGYSVGIIHNPNELGSACNYEHQAIDLVLGTFCYENLPSFIQSYLNDPSFTGQNLCLGDSTRFAIDFINGIDSVLWQYTVFPNTYTSTLFSPVFLFPNAGNFQVSLTVYSGNLQKTVIQTVTIHPAPVPELGNDTTLCSLASFQLDAGSGYELYQWNGGFGGSQFYTPPDTGTYFVRVRNAFGCYGNDTIHIGLFSPPLPDETNLLISPTTCGNATGAIRGIEITGTQPIILEWRDNDNTIISNEPDLFNLPIGNYYLWATDGNGCTNQLAQYQIFDQGDVLIDSVDYTDSYCGQNNGSITVTAISGLSDMLEYSIDNGLTWHSNEGEFTGLVPDSYTVRVRVPDGSGCETMYGENPVEILSNGSLDVVSVVFADDHCSNGMGEITVTGPGNDPSVYWYSNDGGTTWLQNNGEFTSLTEGTYNLMIRDASGCTGAYIDNPVEIDNLPGPAITTPIIITPETGSDANGTITLTATGDDLSYSLDSGPTQDNGHFNGLSEGDYTITITDLFGCITDTLIHVDQITGSYLLAMAGNDRKCLHKIANSNIRVTSITGVKNLKATLSYDGQRLLCTHFNDSLPGITATIYETLSRIVLEWIGATPITSTDTISLGELIFQTKETGLADVVWDLDASNTFFKDENGNSITPVLIPGTVTVHDPPVLALSDPLPLCQGSSTTLVSGITGGTEPISYQWQTPQGTAFNTEIEIENATPDNTGTYTLMVSDYFNCADTVAVALEVVPLPRANFPTINDTIYYEQNFQLEATPGYASYEWSTGDTTYYITVTEEGAYSLLMETTEGCLKLENVMMINTFLPVLVPNAFTPNGDGLNDTFRPVVDYERVRMFNMVIYNRWGQMIFETSDPVEGWDGKDAPAGVYSWVISYSDYLGKMFKMKGGVTLIR